MTPLKHPPLGIMSEAAAGQTVITLIWNRNKIVATPDSD